jgi:hypothetical protein
LSREYGDGATLYLNNGLYKNCLFNNANTLKGEFIKCIIFTFPNDTTDGIFRECTIDSIPENGSIRMEINKSIINGSVILNSDGNIGSIIDTRILGSLSAVFAGSGLVMGTWCGGGIILSAEVKSINNEQWAKAGATRLDLDADFTSTQKTNMGTAVWATTARSLTTFGTLVADIATAVWASGTRSLTTFGTLVADIKTAIGDLLNTAIGVSPTTDSPYDMLKKSKYVFLAHQYSISFDFGTYTKAVVLYWDKDRPLTGNPDAWRYCYTSTGANPSSVAEIAQCDRLKYWADGVPV